MVHEWLMVAVGLVLTVGTGFFVAAEFALVNLDRNDLESRERRGETGLAPTIKALRITSTHLSGAQLGITLTTLLTGFTFEPAISSLLGGPLTGLGFSAAVVPVLGSVIGVALATLFSMVVGELVPKNFALALPLATAKVVVPFQRVFTAAFRPLIMLFNASANAIVAALGVEPKEELSGARTAEELSSLVRRSATEGSLDEDHATLLSRTLRFSARTTADVMTPRVRMERVEVDTTATEIIELAARTGFSRFPVVGADVDDIVGVVHVKHAFAVSGDRRAGLTAADLVREAARVPESMGVDTLLGVLRRGGFQIAIVSDEYGGTAGVVTLEDLVEELVGELADEHDPSGPGIARDGVDTVFDAGLRPDELFDQTGIAVPEGAEYDTVAGFVLDTLDRIPDAGDEVELERGVLRVERVDGARLEQLRFVPAAESADEPEGDHG